MLCFGFPILYLLAGMALEPLELDDASMQALVDNDAPNLLARQFVDAIESDSGEDEDEDDDIFADIEHGVAPPEVAPEAAPEPVHNDGDSDDVAEEELQGLDTLDVEQGVQVLKPRVSKAAGAYRGLNRTPAHMAYVRKCLELADERQNREQAGQQYGSLQKAWNSMRLRLGDQAQDLPGTTAVRKRRAAIGGPGEPKVRRPHPNQWCTDGVLRVVWKDLGKRRVDLEGLDGTHNTLDATAAVACACDQLQTSALSEHVKQREDGECHVVDRHYDASPVRLSFTQPDVREKLMPLARYFVKDGNRWKAVPYSAYRELNRRCMIRFGVLEVFAQTASISSTCPGGLVQSVDFLVPPSILARAASAVIFSAVQSIAPLSADSLRALSKRSTAVFLNDCPDSASSNTRCKAYTAALLRDLPNLLLCLTACCVHLFNKVVVYATRAKQITGDVYAIAYTCSRIMHQSKLQAALWQLVLDMEIQRFPPAPEWEADHRDILARTLCRRMVGALDPDSGEQSAGEQVFFWPEDNPKRMAIERLLRYLNGNWALLRLQHHCVKGICDCVDEDDCRAKTFAALLECGATLGSDVRLPSAKDWGTTNETAGQEIMMYA